MLRLLEEMNEEDDMWCDDYDGKEGGETNAISIHVLNGKAPSREERPCDALLSDEVNETMESET